MWGVWFVSWFKDGWLGIGEFVFSSVDGVLVAFLEKGYDLFFFFPFGLPFPRGFSLLLSMIFRVVLDQTRWVGTASFVSLGFSRAKMVFFVARFGFSVARMISFLL